MHSTSKWAVLLRWAVLLTVVGLLLVPTPSNVARAGTLQQAQQRNPQIVYLDTAGRLQVTGYQNNTLTPAWNSGTSVNWTNFITGDFNGDGRKEIIATRANEIQGFSPSGAPFSYHDFLPSQDSFQFLAVGDFKNLGRDQLAATFRYRTSGGRDEEELWVWVFNTDGSFNRREQVQIFDYFLSGIVAGDVTRDGQADLMIMRQSEHDLIGIQWSGNLNPPGWTWFFVGVGYCCEWTWGGVGNIDKRNSNRDDVHPGNEIVFLRQAEGRFDGIILGWWNPRDVTQASTLDTFTPYNGYFQFATDFKAATLVDFYNDAWHNQQIIALRDAIPFMTVFNPYSSSGAATSLDFSQDYRGGGFDKVAAGDLNGDGRVEVVLGGSAGLRVYPHAQINEDHTDFAVSVEPDTPVEVSDVGISPNVLSANPAALAFTGGISDVTATKQVVVTNSGTGGSAIAWHLSADKSWIKFTPASGGTPGAFNVWVDARNAGMIGGTKYTGNLVLTATDPSVIGSPKTIPVTYDAKQPTLAVSPTTLNFSIPPSQFLRKAALPVQVFNGTTSDTLTWTATALNPGGRAFASVDRSSGVTPSTLHVMVDPVVAGVGNHQVEAQVNLAGRTPGGASAGTASVAINVDVPDPGFVIDTTSLGLFYKTGDTSPLQRTLRLWRPPTETGFTPVKWIAGVVGTSSAEVQQALQSGKGVELTQDGLTVNGQALAAPTWINLSKTSGTTDVNGPTSIVITVNPTGLAPGVYKAEVVFLPTGTADPTLTSQILSVTLVVSNQRHKMSFPSVTR